MARLVTTGFEWASNGSHAYQFDRMNFFALFHDDPPLAQYTTGRASEYAYRMTNDEHGRFAQGDDLESLNTVMGNGYAMRAYIRLSAIPNLGAPDDGFYFNLLTFIEDVRVVCDRDGRVALLTDFVPGPWSAPGTLTANEWYCVEIGVSTAGMRPTGSPSYYGVAAVEVRIDGATVASDSCRPFYTQNPFTDQPVKAKLRFWIDNDVPGLVYDVDDVGINDSTGGWQNTWLGPGEVHLLLPTGDVSVGNWRWGSSWSNSQTTNLYDEVNNRPPVGVGAIQGPPIRALGSPEMQHHGSIYGPSARAGTRAPPSEAVPDAVTFSLSSFTGSGAIDVVFPHAGAAACHDVGTFSEGTFEGIDTNLNMTISAGGVSYTVPGVWWELLLDETNQAWRDYHMYQQSGHGTTAPSTITVSKAAHTDHTSLALNAVGVYVESGHVAQGPLPTVNCARLMCVL